MAQTILIIEDDKHIAKLLRYNFEKAGYFCEVTISGEEGLKILDQKQIDGIILDVMLPKMDGFDVCRRIKQQLHLAKIPVLMLTAKGEEVDRVVGFELGADDYVVKPFSVRELLLRVKALLKRGQGVEKKSEMLLVEKLKLDIPRHKVMYDDKPVELAAMEFRLLTVLMQRQGRVQSRETLLNDVWGISAEVTTRTVDTHVKLLRHKLGKGGKLIETVRGMGYRLAEE